MSKRDFQKVAELRPGSKTALEEVKFPERSFAGAFANPSPLQMAKSEQLDTLLGMVEFKFTQGDHEGIQADLQAIYDLAQDCVKAQLYDAKLHLARKDYDQVVATTGRLLKSDPSNLQALTLRGKGYFYSGDHDLAKRHYGEALKHDPDYSDAKKEFSKVRELVGDDAICGF